jgi:hypothetical protein
MVRAQVSGEARAAAEMLFREARQLMAEGKYADACPKFADSQRLDPAVGTVLNLALCYKQNGQTASAWVTYRSAASEARKAGQVERAKHALAEADALEPGLCHLRITLSPQAQAAYASVKLNGTPIPTGLIGAPMPADPGEHLIVASALGKRDWSTRVKVAGTTPAEVVIPGLADAPAPAEAPSRSGPAPKTGVGMGPGTGPDGSPPIGRNQRLAAIGVAGVGLAAIVVGSVLAVSAKLAYDDASRSCRASVCSAAGLARDESARNKAGLATVAFTVGAVGLGGGVALWFTAPRPPETSPSQRMANRATSDPVAASSAAAGLLWSGVW